ncbi:MAG: tetratricopeptide repeat protein, partial [bacterium]|nr:tetratricopeptide repeat protein [bacterium]
DENKLNIAEQEYHNVYKTYPNSLEAQKALFQIAHINYLRGNYEEAQEKLDYILSRYIDTPLQGPIYTEKGYIYMAGGELKKALKMFNQKENLNEDLALLGKAECYFRLGEYVKGLNIYEDFITYRKTSNYRRMAIDKFLNNCYDYARKLAKEKDYKYSNLLYEKLITLFPDYKLSENALYWLSENYYDQKDYNKAVATFKKTLNNKFSHKDDAALFKLGICYFDNGEFEEALKYFQNLLDNYPRSTYYNMAADWKRQVLREIKYRH